MTSAEVPYLKLSLALSALAALATLGSLFVGYVHIDVWQAAADAFAGRQTLPELALAQLRLPRAILGAGVGFTLGISGAAMQGLLRNPLADPGVIGVSGGAALGAVVAFYSGFSHVVALGLPIGGVVGALVAAITLYALAGRSGGTMTLILAGVTINAIAGALTSLALNLSPNPYAVYEIMFWLMGSLEDRSLPQVGLALPLIAVGAALMLTRIRALDALTLGEDTAQSLGFDLAALRWSLVAGASLSVGASVAVSGAIGFVGLVAPHLMRPLVGYRPGRLLWVSGLTGAILLVVADVATRLIPTHPELKLGVLTSLVGAPFLLALVNRSRERG